MPDRIDAIIMPKLAELVERVKLLEKNLEDTKETLDSISGLAYKVTALSFRIDKLEPAPATTTAAEVGSLSSNFSTIPTVIKARPKKVRKKKEA